MRSVDGCIATSQGRRCGCNPAEAQAMCEHPRGHRKAPVHNGSRAHRSLPSAQSRLLRRTAIDGLCDRPCLNVWYLNDSVLARVFELMVRYADHSKDVVDASLMVLAETLELRKVFTIDRSDFTTYRIKRGYRRLSFEILA